MFDNVRLAAIGTATVIDAVLLIAMLERPNRRRVAVWMWLMTAATFLFHGSSFIHHLLNKASDEWALHFDRAAMVAICLGLLVLPSAIVHGSIRVTLTGIDFRPKRDWRYALVYLPVLLIAPISGLIDPGRSRDFLQLMDGIRKPYIVYFLITMTVAAICYLRLRSSELLSEYRRFLTALSITFALSGVTTTLCVWYGLDAWPQASNVISLIVALVPMVTAILFIYYVLRFGLLSLLLERTLVYGAIVVAFLLVHELVFSGIRDQLSNRYRINFAILEVIAAIALILLYTPFRQRVSEALRYLTGARADVVRIRTREISTRMTAATGKPTDEILVSVADDVRQTFSLSHAEIRLRQSAKDPAVDALVRHIQQTGERHTTTWRDTNADALGWLAELKATAAFLLDHGEVVGLLLTGPRAANQRLSDEEVNSLVLLAEQLAVTLQLEQIQSERMKAERRAIQQEKLSTLGLLAGSIAHEVRNPLSSIKTITSVMAEDLGPNSEHADDLKLILGEIDRLTATTGQLLAFARSEPQNATSVRPAVVLQQTLQLLRHVARRDDVEMSASIETEDDTIVADVNSLREIYFNLLRNSLEAAGSGGRIKVHCARENGHLVTRIRDNGPGVAPEIQDRLFEPFATTKEDGTGLGLYIVGRHVRDLGGEIHCESIDDGTQFTLKLPIAQSSQS